MDNLAAILLKEKSLKITSQRIAILEIMLSDMTKAYSLSNLMQTLEHDMNRSTVYRTLETLREKNLFLKMIDSKGIAFYTVNLKRKCQNNIHPHLKCNSCGGVICLPAFPSEYIQTLERAGVNNLDVVLNGICPNCN